MQKTKIIKDLVHGYIDNDKYEAEIIKRLINDEKIDNLWDDDTEDISG